MGTTNKGAFAFYSSLISCVASPGTYLPTSLTTMIRTKIKTRVHRFSQDNYFVNKAVNFPSLQAKTVNIVFSSSED